ncbi:MAG: hypothetical protein LBK76_08830 [Verrucomicrobiales bacterium]|jgi:hypothetical protein|nr:hypothetical protein [Verrucomicrobiales bacterium]
MHDLFLFVADKNMKFALQGLLGKRHASLGIRPITFDIKVNAQCDSGMRTMGVQLLSLEVGLARHALMLLDFAGSGTAYNNALDLENALKRDLQNTPTWGTRGEVIVIDPELEILIWGNDNKLCEILKWPEEKGIREWLRQKGFMIHDTGKPDQPKEAFECVLRHCNIPRSSTLYQEITEQIGLKSCRDSTFLRLKSILQNWFPADSA